MVAPIRHLLKRIGVCKGLRDVATGFGASDFLKKGVHARQRQYGIRIIDPKAIQFGDVHGAIDVHPLTAKGINRRQNEIRPDEMGLIGHTLQDGVSTTEGSKHHESLEPYCFYRMAPPKEGPKNRSLGQVEAISSSP